MKWGSVSISAIEADHSSIEYVTLKGEDRINIGKKGIWHSFVVDCDTSSIACVFD